MKMKRIAPLFLVLFLCGEISAQNIVLEQASPMPLFQDADVGAMAFADIDNDGDQDLLITGKGGPIKTSLYQNDGNGNFTELTGTPFLNVFGGTVEFEDVDNDGDQDVFITGSTSAPARTAHLYLNDGAGNFTLLADTPFEPSESGDCIFVDVDGDDDQDLIMTGYDASADGFSSLYLNDGSGIFTEVVPSPFEALKSSAVASINIDNDDDQDLIFAGENDNGEASSLLYTNDGTGNFSLVSNSSFTNMTSGDIAIGDPDNDGDQDILMSGQTADGSIESILYVNDGTGSFTELTGTPFPGTHVGPSSFADFDNDGDMDVLLVGSGPGGLIDNSIIANIYENQGSNSFILADSLIGAYLSSSAIADVDGDDDLDLVIGGTSTGFPVRGTRMYLNKSAIASSIRDDKDVVEVLLYPNPSHGQFTVQFREVQQARINIYRATGERVYSQEITHLTTTPIELNQAAGLYLLVIQTKDGIVRRKLILE